MANDEADGACQWADTSPPIRLVLKQLLAERKRSARSVALGAGLSSSALKHILNGSSASPGVATLAAIAKELGVPLSVLTGDASLDEQAAASQPAAHGQGDQFIKDAAELRLVRFWRVLDEDDRRRILNAMREAILKDG